MFVFGLGTVPMLVATHETVGWLRDKIGRFRLRQMNGALMVLSGIAVIVVPLVMANMHGGHDMSNMSGDPMQMSESQMLDMPMDHSSHSAITSNADATPHQDISQMNQDMTPATVDPMDHSMHDMSNEADMENSQNAMLENAE